LRGARAGRRAAQFVPELTQEGDAMARVVLWFVLVLMSPASWALSPYLLGDKLRPADLATQMSQVEKRLQAEGFTVVGRHMPKGLPLYGSVTVTDRAVLEAIRSIGGAAIVAAGLRVGVQTDGTVSYINPEYWYRATLRSRYDAAQAAVQSAQARLLRALGEGAPFGGDVAVGSLADYRYMIGTERFESSRNELQRHASFDEALRVVRDNLGRQTANVTKVYEVVMPDRKVAVFGVAMNDSRWGEGWWVNKLDPRHIAALPYEIYIVDNTVYALYARYRIALSWPALDMGTFMRISHAPGAIYDTLGKVAGAATQIE
jgi:hypothetical protein